MMTIPVWVLILALFFTVLIGVVIALQIKIITTNQVIVRAIPLGTVNVQERPAGRSATGSTARHGGES